MLCSSVAMWIFKKGPCGLRGCKNRPAPFPGQMKWLSWNLHRLNRWIIHSEFYSLVKFVNQYVCQLFVLMLRTFCLLMWRFSIVFLAIESLQYCLRRMQKNVVSGTVTFCAEWMPFYRPTSNKQLFLFVKLIIVMKLLCSVNFWHPLFMCH